MGANNPNYPRWEGLPKNTSGLSITVLSVDNGRLEALDLTKASMWTVRRRIGQKRRPCLCDFDGIAPILTGGFLVRDFRKPFSAVIAKKIFSGVILSGRYRKS